ncbi:MAG: hypothetical protein HY722_00250 [Planctomycetes bacterium]|nr:hypothetical protein [Planctomycetota bacterium]
MDREVPTPAPFWQALVYSLLVWVPVTGWFYYRYTDWSLAYLMDSARVPGYVGPAALFSYVAGIYGGYLGAQCLIQHGHKVAAAVMTVGALGLTLAIYGATADQYAHVGTFAQYHAGLAPPLDQVEGFPMALNLAGALLALPYAGFVVYNVASGRRAP